MYRRVGVATMSHAIRPAGISPSGIVHGSREPSSALTRAIEFRASPSIVVYLPPMKIESPSAERVRSRTVLSALGCHESNTKPPGAIAASFFRGFVPTLPKSPPR